MGPNFWTLLCTCAYIQYCHYFGKTIIWQKINLVPLCEVRFQFLPDAGMKTKTIHYLLRAQTFAPLNARPPCASLHPSLILMQLMDVNEGILRLH